MSDTHHAEATRAARPPDPSDPPARRRRTPEQRAADAKRIVSLYVDRHHSVQQIVEEIGLSHGTVYNTLVDAGVQMRSRGGIHPRRRRRTSSSR